VTGAPQILHFRQIFEIARREGYKPIFAISRTAASWVKTAS